MVDEDAKIIGVVGGLTLGTKLWKDMNRNWLKTYIEFWECAGVIMSITKALAREIGGSDYKAPDNIKAFAAENVEIMENLNWVLSVNIDTIYYNIKD
ncbi:hypothetical protein ACS0TY_013505 [Phlomoides rotata]